MTMMTRRSALATFGAVGLLFITGEAASALAPRDFIRPPGALAEEEFLSRCIRCQKCTQVCHAQVIQPVSIVENLAAHSTPTVSFLRGYCDFCEEIGDGNPRCIEVCPTGALVDTGEKPKLSALAKIVRENCIAWDLAGCEVCVHECPREAIYQDEKKRPYIDTELCDGCGLCELVCPSVSIRSASILVGNGKGVVMLPKSEVIE